MESWWLAATGIFIAGLVQGLAGFSFGIWGMVFLTLCGDFQTANVIVSLLAMGSVLHAVWHIRHAIMWRSVGMMCLGYSIGIPVGTKALVTDSAEIYLRYLLALLCLLVAWQASRNTPVETTRGHDLGEAVGMGAAAGFLGAALSVSAPPVLWYVYRRPWSCESLKSTTLAIFGTALLLKFATFAVHDLGVPPADDLLTLPRLVAALGLVPVMLAGSALGVRLFVYFDRDRLRRLVCVLLGAVALLIAGTTYAQSQRAAVDQNPSSRALTSNDQ